MIQIIEFPTWSRIVNNELKESTLDHIYLTDPTICTNIESLKPCFGDHMLITINIHSTKSDCVYSSRRDWRKYSKVNLVNMLNEVEWCYEINDVQSFWNNMELKIVKIVDIIAPITMFSNNYVPPRIPPLIKSKINKRNRLLNLRKRNSSNELKCRINVLNFEIKQKNLLLK